MNLLTVTRGTLTKRTQAGLAVLFAMLVITAACSSTSDTNDADGADDTANTTNTASTATQPCVDRTGERITVYSGRSESLMAPVFDAYECTSGNAVDVRWGSSTDLALLAGEEGDQSPADIFLSRSPGPVGFLQGKDFLQPINTAVLDLVPELYRSQTGHWVGITGRKRVLVYNIDNTDVADLPDSVFDLTDEQYRSRVAIPASNGSFVDWLTVFRFQHGDDVVEDWIDEIAANDSRYYPNNRSIVEAVGRGEIDFGLVNHYYNYQVAQTNGGSHRGANHELGEQDIGALLIITAAGVTSHTEKAELANDLLAYLLSSPSQRFFTDSSLEYPLARGIAPNAVLPNLAAPAVGAISFDDLGAGFAETNAIIEASGILQQ